MYSRTIIVIYVKSMGSHGKLKEWHIFSFNLFNAILIIMVFDLN